MRNVNGKTRYKETGTMRPYYLLFAGLFTGVPLTVAALWPRTAVTQSLCPSRLPDAACAPVGCSVTNELLPASVNRLVDEHNAEDFCS